MMPVGVMYQSPTGSACVCSHRIDRVLDLDRRQAHHEREPAREEQPRERGDERLHVEVLHEHADQQADRGAAEDITGHHDGGEWPSREQLRAQDAGERHHRADREVDAAGEDHERHADREDQQVGVVEQQRRQVPRGEEVAEVDLRADEQQR